MHAKEAALKGVPGVDEKDLPLYLDKKLNVIMGKTDDGNIIFRTLDGVVPMADLPSLGSGGAGAFLREAMGPLPKALAASMFNIDTFTGRKIEEYDNALTPMVAGTNLPLIPVRVKNMMQSVVGRPLRIAEESMGWKNETPMGALKQTRGFWERNSLVAAYTGIGPQFTDPRANALGRKKDKDKRVNAAIRDAAYYRSRRQFDAAAAAMKRANEMRRE